MAGAGSSSVLEALWRDFAGELPEGGRLADLACGPGQAGRWAAAARPDLHVTGIDLADIGNDGAEEGEPGFRLIGSTPLERLCLADASHDGVISQFGFEYGDLVASAREAARVLKSGGRGLFICHHAGSAIGVDYAARGDAFRAALIAPMLIDRTREVFCLHRDGVAASEIGQAEDALRALIIDSQKRLKDTPPWYEAWTHLRYLRDLAVHPARYEPVSAIARLDVVALESQAWLMRQEAQEAASMDEAGAERMASALSEAGLDVETPSHLPAEDGAVLGWRFGFAKP